MKEVQNFIATVIAEDTPNIIKIAQQILIDRVTTELSLFLTVNQIFEFEKKISITKERVEEIPNCKTPVIVKILVSQV